VEAAYAGEEVDECEGHVSPKVQNIAIQLLVAAIAQHSAHQAPPRPLAKKAFACILIICIYTPGTFLKGASTWTGTCTA
jgi:hypothetical protein